jgi:DNA-binding MarR family transcriptional regulator
MDRAVELALDAETKALEAPHDHKNELRLWLRLLTCATMVETEIRRRLRERFDVTLPRFDLMAQLERAPDGMTLGEVSKRMMVSNGNVTGLVDRLVESGHIVRSSPRNDRRVQIITLTAEGREAFSRMAEAHAEWVAEMFEGLGEKDISLVLTKLAGLKLSVQAAIDGSNG